MSPEVDAAWTSRVLQVSTASQRPSWGFLSRRFQTEPGKFGSGGGRRATHRIPLVPGLEHRGQRQNQVPKSPENPGQFKL